ncbi:class I SAM-dependent methyltransferase [Oscillatoria sp. FACHB-1406]|uniref:class I SAM-dependent methyltransferase n=1 Tax=Oscillatoria sp. FACHB-1406 TaxID=2692846 RepID=UPI0018F04BA7|nr:class I SAM-dependent methyltransferase [Oscillatoria sp. FACHB-1406]
MGCKSHHSDMENVKQTFEEMAGEFDAIIRRLIPDYAQMVEALIAALPFDSDRDTSMIDLGCGTGTISHRVLTEFPNTEITCVDIAENMLAIARQKLERFPTTRYQVGNFETYDFDSTYDAALSSLALHHLKTDEDKQQFYQKIYDNLNPGGVFYNADVVLASSDRLQQMYMNRWKDFMKKQVCQEEIENKWIPKYYEEDRPAILCHQLSWLEAIGFKEVDIIWKYYNFAVYGGRKPHS